MPPIAWRAQHLRGKQTGHGALQRCPSDMQAGELLAIMNERLIVCLLSLQSAASGTKPGAALCTRQ